MKKIIILILSLSLILLHNNYSLAKTKDVPCKITAKSAILMDNTTGRIIYEKSKDKKCIPASITKIMTLLLLFDSIEQGKYALTDEVTVSEYAAKMGGSQVYLEPGEKQTVDTMIKCISIASANDAAVAMAEFDAGTEKAFIDKMNQKAKALKLKNTHFLNCNGLDDSIKSGHYSSAYDIALLSRELITKHPKIKDYSTSWTESFTHNTKKGSKEFGLTNTNKLIRSFPGITGLKTGSTSKAKYCLSATAFRDGTNLTAVIMGAPTPKDRFEQAAQLLNYGFSVTAFYKDHSAKNRIHPIKITGGTKDYVHLRLNHPFSYCLIDKERQLKPKRKIIYKSKLKAPIKEGQQIGKIEYILSGKSIGHTAIIAAENIQKESYLHMMSRILKKLVIA